MEAIVANSTIDWALKLAGANTLDELKEILDTLLNDKKVQKYVRGNSEVSTALFKVLDRVYGTRNETTKEAPTSANTKPKKQTKPAPDPKPRKERKPIVAKCGNEACREILDTIRWASVVYGRDNFVTRSGKGVGGAIRNQLKRHKPGNSCSADCKEILSLAQTVQNITEWDEQGKISDTRSMILPELFKKEALALLQKCCKTGAPAAMPQPEPKVKEKKQEAPAPTPPAPQVKPPEPAPPPASQAEPKKEEEQATTPPQASLTDQLSALPLEKREGWLLGQISLGKVSSSQIRKQYRSWEMPKGFDARKLINLARTEEQARRAATAKGQTLADLAKNNHS